MKSLLITGLLILGKLSLAQTPVKLFVYSQVFTPGMVPQRDIPSEKGGARVNKPSATTLLYICVSWSRCLHLTGPGLDKGAMV